MSFLTDPVEDVFNALTGQTASDAASQASGVQADSQREALQFLREREAIPRQFSEGALQQLGGLFGLGGGGAETLEAIKQSPMYQNVLSTREAGEEAILRNASATGGLRSGNVQDALAGFNIDLENQAFDRSISGLRGLAGLGDETQNIANITQGIGQTQAQGITAAAQARQQGLGNIIDLGLKGAAAFSDARLKENVQLVGQRNGHNWYTWDWADEAERLDLSGSDEGVMAHEIAQTMPEAVFIRDNYLVVDYSKLGVH